MIKRPVVIVFMILLLCTISYAVSDSSPANNLKNTTINVLSMPNLSIVFVPYVNQTNDNIENYTSLAIEQQNFLKQIYPLPDSIQTIIVQSPFVTQMNPWIDRGALNELSKGIIIAGQHPSRVVGIASRSLYKGPGFSSALQPGGVVSGINPILTTTAAHEIAHTLYFCDEYFETEWNHGNQVLGGLKLACLNGDGNQDTLFDDRCKGSIAGQKTCPVESEQLILETFFSSLNISNVSNLMGARFNSTSSSFRRWINNETYVKMITQLNNTLSNSYKQMIVIPASANTTFSVSPKNFYVVPSLFESSQDDFLTGNLSVVTLDSSERILSRIYLDPRSAIFGEDGNVSEYNSTELLIVLPFENVSSILFINNITNTTISRRNVSQNPPHTILSIDLSSPVLERGKPLSIRWNSTDYDNDTLYFTILINDGNSSIYSPLLPEINQTSITYNSSTLPEATNYIIQLLSTDGVNTNVSYSENFSLRNPPEVINLSNLSNINSTQVYEFLIDASSIFNFLNASWSLREGTNVTINSSILFNITSGSNVVVFVEFNATNETITEANVTVISENLTGFAYLRFPHGVLSIENFTQLASSGTMKVFEVIVRNIGDSDINGVNWTFNTGDNQGTQIINSILPFSLLSNQAIRMYLEYNYTNSSGTHEATIILNSSQSNIQSSINVSFASSGLTIANFSVLGQSQFNATFELLVQNTGASKDSNSWALDTGDGAIQSITGYNLSSNQTIYIFIEHNYSRFDQFSPTASVNTDEDVETTSLSVSEFMVSNLSSLIGSGLNRTFEFFIVNIWGPTLAANWTLNTGVENTSSTYSVLANSSKNVTVYFQYDYPTLQNRTITATVYTNQSNHTQTINI